VTSKDEKKEKENFTPHRMREPRGIKRSELGEDVVDQFSDGRNVGGSDKLLQIANGTMTSHPSIPDLKTAKM
jgi:hypothetical protein